MFRLDVHSHTGHSSDSLLPAAQLLAAAVRRGLSAIAVTDHNNITGALQAASLVERDPERLAGLAVIVGEEVMTNEGELIGLFLREQIPRGLSPEETIRRIRGQGGLVVVPHPFDRLRRSRLLETAIYRVASRLDAVEVLNARTCWPTDNLRALDFAQEFGLPMVGGSDAHTPGEVGNAYVELPDRPATDATALLAQFRGETRIGGRLSSPSVHLGSSLARWRKRLGLAPAIQL